MRYVVLYSDRSEKSHKVKKFSSASPMISVLLSFISFFKFQHSFYCVLPNLVLNTNVLKLCMQLVITSNNILTSEQNCLACHTVFFCSSKIPCALARGQVSRFQWTNVLKYLTRVVKWLQRRVPKRPLELRSVFHCIFMQNFQIFSPSLFPTFALDMAQYIQT